VGRFQEPEARPASAQKEFTVDFVLGYRSSSDSAGVEVPAKSLEMFIDLQVPFGLSIIIT